MELLASLSDQELGVISWRDRLLAPIVGFLWGTTLSG
jgi:hypothetical protein